MKMVNIGVGVAVLSLGLASACQKNETLAPSSASAPSPAVNCAVAASIDDAEDNDAQIAQTEGRGGYIYTYADTSGSTIEPSSSGFMPSQGGAVDSAYALRISGKMTTGGESYAGVGFNFTESETTYDASGYAAISFYAKVGDTSAPHVRFQVADVNTDPKGQKCTECYNDFGAPLTLTTEWKKYVVPFAALKQQGSWGDPTPQAVETTQLYGVKWQVTTPGADYDLWIDNVQLEGCP